jgi:hypothetical protein
MVHIDAHRHNDDFLDNEFIVRQEEGIWVGIVRITFDTWY